MIIAKATLSIEKTATLHSSSIPTFVILFLFFTFVIDSIVLLHRDFAVVDVILTATAVEHLDRILLLSSIWFDVTDGRTFLSHHDDGLHHSVFGTLAQTLAAALSPGIIQDMASAITLASPSPLRSSPASDAFRVVKHYAVAMSLSRTHVGPFATVGEGEVVLVLFLNKNSRPIGDEEDGADGLRILDPVSSRCLHSKGITDHPSVHPDLLTFGGRYNFNVTSVCQQGTSELVPRRTNRIVVIGSGRSFSFSTVAAQKEKLENENSDDEESNYDFESDTMLAVVITLAIIKQ